MLWIVHMMFAVPVCTTCLMREPRTLKFMESVGLGKWLVPMLEKALTSRHPELSQDGVAHDQACLLKGAIDAVVPSRAQTRRESRLV